MGHNFQKLAKQIDSFIITWILNVISFIVANFALYYQSIESHKMNESVNYHRHRCHLMRIFKLITDYELRMLLCYRATHFWNSSFSV